MIPVAGEEDRKKKITELIPNNFGSVIPPPKLPNIIPKTVRQVIRCSSAHTSYQDQLIPETHRFGNHRAEITKSNSKMIKFGSVIILCNGKVTGLNMDAAFLLTN